MTEKRDAIIETAGSLLESRGYFGTGLSQIIEESGAPRGSLYYYFPGGKDEITEAAIRKTGQQVERSIRSLFARAETPAKALEELTGRIAEAMKASGFKAGGPITTVALETATTNERLNGVCREIYESWRRNFAMSIEASGVSPDRADRLAMVVLAALEGAIILSRTHHRVEPLEDVAREMGELLELARVI